MNGLPIVLLLSAVLVQPSSTLVAQLFADLGVRAVSSPAYTLEGENQPQPYCARTDLSAGTGNRSTGCVTGGWRVDHSVWLRLYRGGAYRYAVVYTTARTFNVQVVCLGCR